MPWFYRLTRKAVSVTFTGFCEQVLAAYPTAPVVALVCDNVIIHRSKRSRRPAVVRAASADFAGWCSHWARLHASARSMVSLTDRL
jgi:hypothetical protein